GARLVRRAGAVERAGVVDRDTAVGGGDERSASDGPHARRAAGDAAHVPLRQKAGNPHDGRLDPGAQREDRVIPRSGLDLPDGRLPTCVFDLPAQKGGNQNEMMQIGGSVARTNAPTDRLGPLRAVGELDLSDAGALKGEALRLNG